MSLLLVLAAALVCGASGVPALLGGRGSNRAQRLAALMSVAGAMIGITGVVKYLGEAVDPVLSLEWRIPLGVSFSAALDGLSALFLVPVFLVSGLGAVYGLGYWPQADSPQNGRKLRAFYGLLAGSMALLLVARSSVLFLAAWEAMALAAYFLVATDDRQASVRQAAWIYLVATHVGTTGLLALFAFLYSLSGSFEWGAIATGSITPWQATSLFLLTLVGFGLKAGVMPFHVWLPSAHASAPSHVSALLSGVMIKMGVYGILRFSGYLPDPPLWWGALLIVLGLLSGLMGVAAAIGQRDLKRILAYSSIENVGIILLGVGLALVGRTVGAREWVVLGLGGALLHVLNHGLFKPLLFFGAGAVIHGTHTRDVEALGGLARRMPLTFLGFLAGAWAICGLPAFNGFLSELTIYMGLFRAALSPSTAVCVLGVLAAAGLAMIGALAVACFVRALGALFLGTARSEKAIHAAEAPVSMTSVILLLALACLAIGVAPWTAAPLLERALASWSPGGGDVPGLFELAPLGEAGLIAHVLLAAAAICGLILVSRSRAAGSAGTWDCGYADPTSPRLEYTASSLGEMLVGIFAWAVRLKESRLRPREVFPARDRYESRATEPLLDGLLTPFFHRWADRFSRLRILQRGNVQVYLVYILVTLVIVIAWAMLSPREGP